MEDLSGFRIYLAQRGLKLSTINCHLFAVKRVTGERGRLSFDSASKFISTLIAGNYKGAYINTIIDGLHSWAKYSGDSSYLRLHHVRVNNSIRATMSDEEIEALLGLPAPATANKKHYEIWTLFFSLMAYTGTRPGEIAHLKVENVDFGRAVFLLEDTKTNTPRYVSYPSQPIFSCEKPCTNPFTAIFIPFYPGWKI